MHGICRPLSGGSRASVRPELPAHLNARVPGANGRAGRVLIIAGAGPDISEVERLLGAQNYHASRLDDGWRGYREARVGRPDFAVIAPRAMSMDPMALCWLVGGHGVLKTVPFLFVANSKAHALQAFSMGAADVLPYPFAPAELVARVAIHLKKTAAQSPARHDAALGPQAAGTRDDMLLQSALEIIARDLVGVSDAAGLARRVGTTSKRLSALFHERLGMSVQKYVIDKKMAVAASWLARTRMPVAEIARRLGYEGLSNFSATFRRHVGKTAMEYRRSAREPTMASH